jgi:hypothetical protein
LVDNSPWLVDRAEGQVYFLSILLSRQVLSRQRIIAFAHSLPLQRDIDDIMKVISLLSIRSADISEISLMMDLLLEV